MNNKRPPRSLPLLLPLLLSCGCGKPPHPTLSLHDAILARNVAQVESNLYWGCDVNAKAGEPPTTPIQTAASVGDARIAKTLVEQGSATYGAEDALFGNDPRTIAYLLDRKTLDPSKAFSLYLSALRHGSVAGIRYLAAHQIDANATDASRSHRTCLHWFASGEAVYFEMRDPEGFTAAFNALIEAGANTNAATDEGETPLGVAVEDGNEFAERLLRSRGAVQRGDQRLEAMRAQVQADAGQREQQLAEADRRAAEESAAEERRRAEEDRQLKQESNERSKQIQDFLDDQDKKKSYSGWDQ